MAKAHAEYTVVARRYRPQQFDDLVGQEAVAQSLKNALTGGRVAHAYLFTGARGVGKTSTARILAKALNCEKGPTPTPCDRCTSCQAIAAGDDIDVREIDGASNRGIDDVRAIRQDVSTRPTRSRYKVYIIDEVHMLTRDSFNALLKTLEEPPPHVKFIFATTEVNKVPITILSRCQRFDFGNISAERIAQQLRAVVTAEKMKAEDEALELIARRAGGSMRDAQSLLDQLLAFGGESLSAETVQHLLGMAGPERILALAEAILNRDAKLALERIDSYIESGLAVGDLLDQLIDHWRDLMLMACAGKEARHLNTPNRYREVLEQQARLVSLDTILAGLDILMTVKSRQRGGGHAQTLVQLAVVRLCRLEELTPISQLAYWLSQPGSAPAPTVNPSRESPASNTLRTPIAPPEGKKKSSPHEATTQPELNAQTLPTVWPEILAQVGVMLGGQLQKGGLPAISGPNSLVITFTAEYNAAYEHCSLPSNVQRLERAIKTHTGQDWLVRLERAAPSGATAATAVNGHLPAPPARLRPQEIMQQFPILERALTTLGALPIFVDPGFGSTQTATAASRANDDPEDEN